MNTRQFKLVASDSVKGFNEELQSLVDQGWDLHGDMKMAGTQTRFRHAQMMFKYITIKDADECTESKEDPQSSEGRD